MFLKLVILVLDLNHRQDRKAVNDYDSGHKKMSKDLQKKYEDSEVVGYLFESVSGFKDPHHQYRLELLVNLTKQFSPSKALEVGCGGGQLVRQLTKVGIDIVGIDLSLSVLFKVSQENSNLNLVRGDAVSLPFKADFFDIVICSEVLEHIPDCELAAKEIARVLNSGGRAIITVPNLWRYDALEGKYKVVSKAINILNFLRARIRKPPLDFGSDMHLHKMTPLDWRKMLEKSGLVVIADFPLLISPYVPGSFKILKALKMKVSKIKGLKKLQMFLDRYLGKVRPFKFMGQHHVFIVARRQSITQ